MYAGVVDSSGLKFTFSSEPSRYRAGILSFFHSSTNFLVIPPGRDNYVINAVCSDGCTEKVSSQFVIKLHFNNFDNICCVVFSTWRHHSVWQYATYTSGRYFDINFSSMIRYYQDSGAYEGKEHTTYIERCNVMIIITELVVLCK